MDLSVVVEVPDEGVNERKREVTAILEDCPTELLITFDLHTRLKATIISCVLILLSMLPLLGEVHPSAASLSASSLPWIPQWLGIHAKLIFVPAAW